MPEDHECCPHRAEFDPETYDFTKSTSENYLSESQEFVGMYAETRAELDFSYHKNYVPSRQLLQDRWIEDVIGGASPKESPWIVFTAGAMGAGKSYVIDYMSKNGYFPLPDIVQIDPDIFRTRFPEWNRYVKKNKKTGGFLTRKEAGYIVEIAEHEALKRKKNVWVDGSLRNGKWYKQHLRDIKKRYPDYRIAIIFVYANKDIVMSRASKRGEITGREVPFSEIEDSLTRVPQSVEFLSSEVQFLAKVENNGGVPRLIYYADDYECYKQTNSVSFDQIRLRFATHPDMQKKEWAKKAIEQLFKEHDVILFGKSYCSFSRSVENLMVGLNIEHSNQQLDKQENGMALQLRLYELSGIHTMPQVYSKGKFVGDCTKIIDLHEKNELLSVLGVA